MIESFVPSLVNAAKRWTLKIQGMYTHSLYVFVVDGLTIDYSNRKYRDRGCVKRMDKFKNRSDSLRGYGITKIRALNTFHKRYFLEPSIMLKGRGI